MAFAVYTGSSTMPSVRATSSSASVESAVGMPYPPPTKLSSTSIGRSKPMLDRAAPIRRPIACSRERTVVWSTSAGSSALTPTILARSPRGAAGDEPGLSAARRCRVDDDVGLDAAGRDFGDASREAKGAGGRRAPSGMTKGLRPSRRAHSQSDPSSARGVPRGDVADIRARCDRAGRCRSSVRRLAIHNENDAHAEHGPGGRGDARVI